MNLIITSIWCRFRLQVRRDPHFTTKGSTDQFSVCRASYTIHFCWQRCAPHSFLNVCAHTGHVAVNFGCSVSGLAQYFISLHNPEKFCFRWTVSVKPQSWSILERWTEGNRYPHSLCEQQLYIQRFRNLYTHEFDPYFHMVPRSVTSEPWPSLHHKGSTDQFSVCRASYTIHFCWQRCAPHSFLNVCAQTGHVAVNLGCSVSGLTRYSISLYITPESSASAEQSVLNHSLGAF